MSQYLRIRVAFLLVLPLLYVVALQGTTESPVNAPQSIAAAQRSEPVQSTSQESVVSEEPPLLIARERQEHATLPDQPDQLVELTARLEAEVLATRSRDELDIDISSAADSVPAELAEKIRTLPSTIQYAIHLAMLLPDRPVRQ